LPTTRRATEMEKIYNDGVALYQQRQYEAAAGKFSEVLKNRSFIPSGKKDLLISTIFNLANCYYNLKNYDSGIKYLNLLVRKFPYSGKYKDALFLLSASYLKKEQYDDAINTYYKIIELDPNDIGAVIDTTLQISYCYQKKREFDKAAAAIDSLKAKYARFNSRLFEQNCNYLLFLLLTQEDKNKAISFGKKICEEKDNPWSNEICFRIGNLLFEDEKYKEAMEFYSQVISSAAVIELIKSLEEAVESRKEYAGAETIKPWELSTLKYLIQKTGSEPDLLPRALFQIAKCHYLLGDYDTAEKMFSEIKSQYPTQKEIIDRVELELSLCYLKKNKLEFFEETVSKIEDMEQRFFLLQELYKEKMYDIIIKLYNMGKFTFDREKYEPLALYMLGDTYYNAKDFYTAMDIFNALISKYPDSEQKKPSQYKIGQCYIKLNQYEQALPIWFELLETYTEHQPEVIHMIVLTYSNLKNYEKAVEYADAFLKSYVGHALAPEVFYLKGSAFIAQKLYDKALYTFNKMIEQFPNAERTPYAYFNIGTIYYQQEKYDDMLKVFLKLEKEFPELDEIQAGSKYWIGWYNEHVGEFDKAIEKYREVCKLYPQESWSKEAILGIGRCYLQKGDYIAARNEYLAGVEKLYEDRDYLLQLLENINLTFWKSGSLKGSVKLYKQLIDKFTALKATATVDCLYFKLATIYYYGAKDKKAAEIYKEVLPKLPEEVLSPQDKYMIGEVFFAVGDYKEALSYYLSFLSGAPAEGFINEAVRGVANCYIKLRDNSIKNLLIDLTKRYPEAHLPEVKLALAEIYRSERKYNLAIPLYEEAVNALGDDELTAEALYGLGESYRNTGKYKEAMLCYKRLELVYGYYEELAKKAKLGAEECKKYTY
jgi:TolA-binding protein